MGKTIHSIDAETQLDLSKPVQIADNIYWVGVFLTGDPFQCHPYFIENGNQSILIDPGSMIQKDQIIEKIQMVCTLEDVKYIILHHQDPDLCAAVPYLEKLINRDDLQIITHSRMSVLIKHYGLKSGYYNIDQKDFRISAGSLSLEFYTTPYCHSPGAFVTYCPRTKILFSGDLFGGLEENWQFYADDNYFKHIEGFHMSYMPSRDILNYSLTKIEDLDIELIAPQHGSLIRRQYIPSIIKKMKDMNSGLYIDSKYSESLMSTIEQLNNIRGELQTTLTETQSLKQQQDGDYYLTSLLQKPLMNNLNKSDKVSTDFLVYQKKIFLFRNKYYQLGGDFCITANLNFQGKMHTFFFNGDSMGKSIQGAGGTLVMGTVLNSIIHRDSGTGKILDSEPEEWMENTYFEIQNIFLSFEEGMMVTGAFGLIYEETGEMLYINAEHPMSVLLRDGKASFMDKEISAHQFGSLSELNFKIVRVKLQEGDILLIASDGRDDINLTPKSEKATINEDSNLFLRIAEKSGGDLEIIVENLMKTGEFTDDLSIMRIGFMERQKYPKHDNELLFKKIIKLHVESLVRNRKFKGALELLQISPENMSSSMLFFRGFCHAHLGRFNRALEYLEMALSKEPDNARALKYAGLCHYSLKSYAKSLELWEKSLQINPSDKTLIKYIQNLKQRISKQRTLLGKKQVNA